MGGNNGAHDNGAASLTYLPPPPFKLCRPKDQNGLKRSTSDWAAGVACIRLMSPRPP